MTSGWRSGMSGGAQFALAPWLAVAVVAFVVAFVNATSELMEGARDGWSVHPAAPFLWEYSSFFVNLLLAPFIGEAIRRVPPRRNDLPRFLAVHFAGTIVYSLIHVAGMVAIRKVGYALAGSFYEFSHGVLPLVLVYEWRKDVIGYAVFGAIYWYFHTRAEQAARQRASADQRIEIRDGGAAVFLPPSEVLWVEAAGNYVEFYTAGRSHLVRGTLASWETRLTAQGFARVHRSRLINRARVRSLKPTPAGDIEITFDDGRTVSGSRRYRDALEAA